MKRSEINYLVKDAIMYLDKMNFKLPPWAHWGIEEWKNNRQSCAEIFENMLGWDLTDFGSGDYSSKGLLLFTIRNGNPLQQGKSYAEKIMLVDENQVTPTHFHWSKMEDIINRGGGNLCLELQLSNEDEQPTDESFNVSIDGIERKMDAGDVAVLTPGESITLYPGLYHRFYGQPGYGRVLVGEVSAVNDDNTDNRFLAEEGRFPDIDEDETPEFLLVGDYQKYNLF